MSLPRIRQDLALYPAPAAEDGSPSWHLHDPAANRFYQLGWAAFEILSRWGLGDADVIVAKVTAETTLALTSDDVLSLAIFLERHHLLDATTAEDTVRLETAVKAQKLHWMKWLLHNYLFFRVPLFHPDRFLDRWCHHIGLFFKKQFWWGAAFVAVIALGLVVRQWEHFVHTFSAYQGLERILSFGLALSVAKVFHELGHAFVARHHGCKVPTMGLAFLVMWPVLYTDTNEAWKLPSSRSRFQIGIAGIATELLLAVLATLVWVVLPDGSARSAAFFLATTSWVLTIGINASPFMRFDGYFLFSDAVGMPNLHSRAFAFGRWWLREKIFALGAEKPENLSETRQRFLIGFAFATWIYRVVLFLSIALLVYHAFFKALGVLLMLVEVGWFIILPATNEVAAWWKERHGVEWNSTTRRSVVLGSILLLWLLLPWQTNVTAPAILGAAQQESLYSPVPAQVIDEPGKDKQIVHKGDVLLRLNSYDLDHRLKLAQISADSMQWALERQTFNNDLLMQGDALKRHSEEAQAEVTGLQQEAEKLIVRAHFDGEILQRNLELSPGAWVTPGNLLYLVANREQTKVDAFVGESDLDRLHLGDNASFIPETQEFGRYRCQVGEIERVYVAELQEPSLASTFGGALPVHVTSKGALIPAATLNRVRLVDCEPALAPSLQLRGTAHLDADGRSVLFGWVRQVLRVFLREGGF